MFEPYAKLVAERCAALRPDRILETAAGTGIVTRAMHRAAPGAQVVATDINRAMLEFAAHTLTSEHVSFEPADAQNLPFADGSFDLVLCQFGVMFFPDKIRANQEARRVLRPNGHYLIVTFNLLDLNPIPKAAQDAVSALFVQNGSRKYAKTADDPEPLASMLRRCDGSTVGLFREGNRRPTNTELTSSSRAACVNRSVV